MDLLKKRISQILMVVILGMLILYAGFHINIHLPEEARMELNRFLGSKAEDTYLTGFAYCKDGSGEAPSRWAAEAAMELVPLGSYVEGKTMTDTAIEAMARRFWSIIPIPRKPSLIPRKGMKAPPL